MRNRTFFFATINKTTRGDDVESVYTSTGIAVQDFYFLILDVACFDCCAELAVPSYKFFCFVRGNISGLKVKQKAI